MNTISRFKQAFKTLTIVVFIVSVSTTFAQDKLKKMPGY